MRPPLRPGGRCAASAGPPPRKGAGSGCAGPPVARPGRGNLSDLPGTPKAEGGAWKFLCGLLERNLKKGLQEGENSCKMALYRHNLRGPCLRATVIFFRKAERAAWSF